MVENQAVENFKNNFKKDLAAVSMMVSVFGLAGWGIYAAGKNLEAIHVKKNEPEKLDYCAGIKKALSPGTNVDLASIVRDYVSRKGGQVLVKNALELYYQMLAEDYSMLAEEQDQSCYTNAAIRKEFIWMMESSYPQATNLDTGLSKKGTIDIRKRDSLDLVVLRVSGSELIVENTIHM